VFPEVGPRLVEVSANKDVSIAIDRAIRDAVSVGKMADQFAGLKVLIQRISWHANHDYRLGGRVAVSARPVGVHPAYGLGQAISRAIEVDGTRFADIARSSRGSASRTLAALSTNSGQPIS